MDNTDDINVGDIDNEFSLGDGINEMGAEGEDDMSCLLYTSPSPRD